MATELTWFLFIAFWPVGLIMLWWVAVKYVQQRSEREFQETARILEMQYVPPSKTFERRNGRKYLALPFLVGSIQGFQCRIRFEQRKKRTDTHLEVFLPVNLQMGLSISPELGVLTKLSAAFGNHDIQINDEVFDQCFHIKGNNPEQVYQFLTPERKMAMYHAQMSQPSSILSVNDTMVAFHVTGIVRPPESMIQPMKQLVVIAQAVCKA